MRLKAKAAFRRQICAIRLRIAADIAASHQIFVDLRTVKMHSA
jgi:hypothetical protein